MNNCVLFDLDGTLLSPPICRPQAACITKAITETFGIDAGVGPDDVPPAVQIDWTGRTDYTVMLGILENAWEPEPPPEAIEAWQQRYEELFLGLCEPSLRYQVREGMYAALRALVRKGYRLRVVTGNTRNVAMRKLAAAGLQAFFDTRYSGFARPEIRDRPELVKLAMKGQDNCTLVGDTWRDMKAATAAGLKPIGWVNERQSEKDLVNAGAFTTIKNAAELVPQIENVFSIWKEKAL